MKFTLLVLTSFALVITGLHLTGCAGIFTKQDAATIGAQIAQDSLKLASQELSGQPVDLKAGVAQIGIKAAAGVVATVQTNLSGTSTTPAAVLNAAASVAQDKIASFASDNPQLAASAQSHAANAVAKAGDEIAKGAIPTVVPDAPLSGK